ncbi:ATP-dependent helicase [Ideonella sp. 4Y11]|uniref:DNA 3'-5' helicase n=1 Tax=Ideonella aquatica TaxID=2824119 RepID=A0A940YHX4_9BURK|nr:ATP-dependent helicase [Ideonella aquatica]MBQ0960558.1 ATP-dependent helicase [Ideonella aquatica]
MSACAPTLNPAQQAAVDHGDAPLLVIAGAGSGKTMTLAARLARLVQHGADPQRILLLSFSRRAAHELARRAGRLLHQALGLPPTARAPLLPWAGTFHGIGARLLREHAEAIGLPPNFSIIDRADAEDLMGQCRQQTGVADSSTERFPLKATCLAIYSRAVNSREPLDALLREHWPWCVAHEAALRRLFGAYVAAKQDQQTLDYDDLLLWWLEMLQASPEIAAALDARFSHVLVDEYQDTNRLQEAILRALKPQGQGLTVVGDDAQAIYGFRAAELRNILDFPARFTPPAQVVTLEENYRSTQPLLDASNAVIALAPERFAKTLFSRRESSEKPLLVAVDDEAAQARWVADEVLRLREGGLKLKRQAVLFRTGSHSAALELELARRRIPFVKFGGLKFLEAAHVKDLLALLRWADNPRSRLAGFRLLNLLPGIGPGRATALLDAMDASPEPWAALAAARVPTAARADLAAFAALCDTLRRGDHGWPDELALAIDWYTPQLQRLHEEDAAVRLLDLQQLQQLAAGHGSRERFLTELTLDPPEATSDESGPPLKDEDYLILSTLHSAKGQEWQAVYLLNLVDGCLPSDLSTGSAQQLEEERRLLYVGMTRAKRHLQLIVPQRFYVTQQRALGERHLYGGRSRFIPDALLPLFEADSPARRARVAAAADEAAKGPPTKPPLDLRARLRSAW